MSDEKTTNLSSITGANLADNDLVMVVDVSDMTMAATGTNKKVTLDEFAQDSTFSSRYAPQANDAIWLGAGQLEITFGSPTRSSASGAGNTNDLAWLLDASASAEEVANSILLPAWWTTFKIDLWQSNPSASSGDVRWVLAGKFAGTGENPQSGSGGAIAAAVGYTIAAPSTANQLKIDQLGGTYTNVAGKPLWIAIWRAGSNAADTLANDIALHGLMFTRLS